MKWGVMGETCSTNMDEIRHTWKVLIEIPEGNRQLSSYRYRWEDNIKMDLKEMVYYVVDWIKLA
jgi:hypothetical protein